MACSTSGPTPTHACFVRLAALALVLLHGIAFARPGDKAVEPGVPATAGAPAPTPSGTPSAPGDKNDTKPHAAIGNATQAAGLSTTVAGNGTLADDTSSANSSSTLRPLLGTGTGSSEEDDYPSFNSLVDALSDAMESLLPDSFLSSLLDLDDSDDDDDDDDVYGTFGIPGGTVAGTGSDNEPEDASEEDWMNWGWDNMMFRRRRRRDVDRTEAPDATTTASTLLEEGTDHSTMAETSPAPVSTPSPTAAPDDEDEYEDWFVLFGGDEEPDEEGEGDGEGGPEDPDEDYDALAWLILSGKRLLGDAEKSNKVDKKDAVDPSSPEKEGKQEDDVRLLYNLRRIFFRARSKVLGRQATSRSGFEPRTLLREELADIVARSLNVSRAEVVRAFEGMATRRIGEALFDFLFDENSDDSLNLEASEDYDEESFSWDADVNMNSSFTGAGNTSFSLPPSSGKLLKSKSLLKRMDQALSPSSVAYFFVEMLGTLAGLSWGVYYAMTHPA